MDIERMVEEALQQRVGLLIETAVDHFMFEKDENGDEPHDLLMAEVEKKLRPKLEDIRSRVLKTLKESL